MSHFHLMRHLHLQPHPPIHPVILLRVTRANIIHLSKAPSFKRQHQQQQKLFSQPSQHPMATTWKPLELAPAIHKPHVPRSSTDPIKPQTELNQATIHHPAEATNQRPNPFDKPLPARTPARILTQSVPGTTYALYTLVSLPYETLTRLLDTLATSHAAEDWLSTIKPAPTHDFSTPNKNSLRDIYDYHTSLLDTVRSNPHKLHASRFVVVVHADWEDNGVLLVELDCHPSKTGVIGMVRVPVGMAGSTIFWREGDENSWEELKDVEGGLVWGSEVEGYTGSKWEVLEEGWFDEQDELEQDQEGHGANEDKVKKPPRRVTMMGMTGEKQYPM